MERLTIKPMKPWLFDCWPGPMALSLPQPKLTDGLQSVLSAWINAKLAFFRMWYHLWKLITEKEDRNGPVFLPSSKLQLWYYYWTLHGHFCYLLYKDFYNIIKQCHVLPPVKLHIHYPFWWLAQRFVFFFSLNNIYYLFSLVSFYGVRTSFSILIDVAMMCLDTFSLISLWILWGVDHDMQFMLFLAWPQTGIE